MLEDSVIVVLNIRFFVVSAESKFVNQAEVFNVWLAVKSRDIVCILGSKVAPKTIQHSFCTFDFFH